MKPIFLSLVILFLTTASGFAGGAPYDWCDFGSGNGKYYGLGEVSNQLTFFLGNTTWISPIPGLETYWRYYVVLIVILLTFSGIWRYRRKSNPEQIDDGNAEQPPGVERTQ